MLTENRTNQLVTPELSDDNFRRTVRHLFAHRWWLLGSMAVSAIIFTAVAFLMQPVYRSTAVLTNTVTDRGDATISLASSALGGLASGLGIGGPRDAETEEALAVLRSREFTERFITDKNLLPKIFWRKWDAAAGKWNTPKVPTLAQGYKYFDEKIRTIEMDRKTGLITMHIDWTNRAEGAQWAIELIHRVNQEMRSRAIEKADAALHYLQDELQRTSEVEVRNALAHLMESQVKKRMIANVTQDYSLRFVDTPVANDGEKPLRPQKGLLILVGPFAGLVLASLLVLLIRPVPRK